LDHFVRSQRVAVRPEHDGAVGKWVAGPGADFFMALQQELGISHLCRGFGVNHADVYALRDEFHLPGMRILQFAFDGKSDNPYLPHNYDSQHGRIHATHDNPTPGWFDELPMTATNLRLLSCRAAIVDVSPALMNLAWSSVVRFRWLHCRIC